MKKIYKIVMTGGPCAGKTTALKKINEEFSGCGLTVLNIPETATELISGGISPQSVGSWVFQNHLLRLQLYKEKIFESAANALDADKILMIFDRAVMDNKGYMEHDAFYKMIGEANLTEQELLSRYDGVLHMETAAKTSKELYQLENNQARFETVDGAIKTDNDLYIAWKDHPNFYAIKSDVCFDKKIDCLLKAIHEIINKNPR